MCLLSWAGCSDPEKAKKPDAGEPPKAARAGRGASEDTLRVQVDYLPRFINPLVNHDRWCHRVMMHNVFETLVMSNASGGYRPHLASAVERQRGGRLVRFTLRSGVTWHDGTPLTSADVKYTLQTVIFDKHSPAPQLQRELIDVVDVRTPNTRTVDLILEQPNYLLEGTLAEVPILPAHIFSRRGVRNGKVNTLPVGSGPLVATERQGKISLVLQRNEQYWGKPARMKRVVVRVIRDPAKALAALRNNEVDVLSNLYHGYYPKQLNRGRLKTHYRVLRLHPYRMRLMIFNTRREPLKELKVRQALVRLADRQRMIRDIRGGLGQVLSAPIWPLSSWYNASIHPTSFDRKAAAELLDSVGWRLHTRRKRRERLGHPLRLRILRTRDSKEMGQAAQILQKEFSAVGINTVVEAGDYHFVLARIRRAEFEVALLGLAPRPEADLGHWFTGSGPLKLGGKGTSLREAAFDALKGAPTATTRLSNARALHRTLHHHPAAVVLYAPTELMVMDKRLAGVANNGRWPKLVGLHFRREEKNSDPPKL